MIRRSYYCCYLPFLSVVPPTAADLYQYRNFHNHHLAYLPPLAQPLGLLAPTVDDQLIVVVLLLQYSHPHSMRLLLLIYVRLMYRHRHHPHLCCVKLPFIEHQSSSLSCAFVPSSLASLSSDGVSFGLSSCYYLVSVCGLFCCW